MSVTATSFLHQSSRGLNPKPNSNSMQVSDLGHCSLPIVQHNEWVRLLEAELFAQVWPNMRDLALKYVEVVVS
jgi:hypothetical protein